MRPGLVAFVFVLGCSRHAPAPSDAGGRPPLASSSASAPIEGASPAPVATTEEASGPREPSLMELVDDQGSVDCPTLARDGRDALFVSSSEDWKLKAAGPRGTRVVGHLDFHGNEQCDLAADARAFYVVYGGMLVPTGRDGQVFRIDRATGAFRRLFHSPHHHELRHLVADEQTLYVAGEEGLLRALAKDGSSAVTFAPYPGSAVSMTSTPSTLLLSTCSDGSPKGCAVLAFDKTTKAMRRLRDHVGPAYAMVTEGETLWVADDAAGTLTRVDVATGDAKRVASIEHVRGLAADAKWIFATSYSEGTLAAIGKTSGKVVELAAGLDRPQAVAATDDSLYVLTKVIGTMSDLPYPYDTPFAAGAVLMRGDKARLLAHGSGAK